MSREYENLTPLQKELYKQLFKKDCYEFVKYFWDEIDPHPFIDGFLPKFFCECFQYMSRPWVGYTGPEKDIPDLPISDEVDVIDIHNIDKNLLSVSVPPRHGKSNIFNVLCSVWLSINTPIKVASVSHTQNLAGTMNIKRQRLLNSAKFKFFFPEIQLKTNTTYSIIDTRGGEMYSVPKNAITGFGADCLLIDDLTNVAQARRDAAEMTAAWSTYTETLPSRINDINKYVLINVMQRIAPNDIVGRILNDSKLSKGYIFIVLPAQFKKHTYIVCPISGEVYEFQEDDYLWPERFGDYSSIKLNVTNETWEAQYQQDPRNSDKTVIKENMIIEKDECEVPSIDQADMVYASHDFPVKDKDTSDFLGSCLAYRVGANLYITDCLEKRMAFGASVDYVTALDNTFNGIIQVIEDKANGSPVLQQLRDKVAGMQAFQPGTQSKTQRLESASLYMISGNVIFVKTIKDKLTSSYMLSESLTNLKLRLLAFPFVDHDDICDAFSMLVLFVFMDRRYMVYGRSFNEYNLVDTSEFATNYSAVFFNKDGDIWKAAEIAIQYGAESKLYVLRETLFKADLQTGLQKLKEFAPGKNVFVDASGSEALSGMYTKDVIVEKYVDDDFEKSVATLNMAFGRKVVLIDKSCRLLRADIDNFKYDKTKSDEAKFKTEKDGFVSCIRSAIKYYGGI